VSAICEEVRVYIIYHKNLCLCWSNVSLCYWLCVKSTSFCLTFIHCLLVGPTDVINSVTNLAFLHNVHQLNMVRCERCKRWSFYLFAESSENFCGDWCLQLLKLNTGMADSLTKFRQSSQVFAWVATPVFAWHRVQCKIWWCSWTLPNYIYMPIFLHSMSSRFKSLNKKLEEGWALSRCRACKVCQHRCLELLLVSGCMYRLYDDVNDTLSRHLKFHL